MTIFEFSTKFPDDSTCRNHLRLEREKQGIICKNCQNIKHYWQSGRSQWQCSKCRFRTTLRSGTIMESSNLSILIWYKTMFLMSATKKSFSANEMQRQLGLKRYEPVWYMMHKIRLSMGNRDDSYSLHGWVEIDEGLFETVKAKGKPSEPLKRGRGSQRQSKILVMAESRQIKPNSNKPYIKQRACGFFKMKKIESFKSIDIIPIVSECLSPTSNALTDALSSYNKLSAVINHHKVINKAPKKTVKLLPWVHIAISNAKRTLLSTYHQVSDQFIQNYLNEFCYKLNRRFFTTNIFDRLITAAIAAVWY
jgi:transposase-like protein